MTASAFGSTSAFRLIATAVTGAAGGNVTGSVGSLAQGVAANVLTGLAVTKIKQIADSFGAKNPDGSLKKDSNGQVVTTTTSETIRAALQGLAGCAGAEAGNASCSSRADSRPADG